MKRYFRRRVNVLRDQRLGVSQPSGGSRTGLHTIVHTVAKNLT
jgi:hypothetical protein